MKKLFLFLTIFFLAVSCAEFKGEDGKDGRDGVDGINGTTGTDGTDGTDQTSDAIVAYNLSGKFQKGRCYNNGEVFVWPLFDGTFSQTGEHFIGFTKSDGSYSIPAEINKEYIFMYSKLICDDEANGGTSEQELYGVRKTSDDKNNVNVLTKITYPVAENLFNNNFGTVEE
ncbi:MAG: hypothetical protein KOO69_03505, partial [Victivallales bacterium]|nr:hypothetical protein [Victivallales bacterium]